jgi:hypothetical protein
MKIADYIKKLIRNYFVIFTVIVMSIAVLRQIFSPDAYFKSKDIFIYMLCALIGDLPSLILYLPREVSEKEMRLRVVIHFVELEAALLFFANVMGFISSTLSTVFLAIQIAIIYALVRFIILMEDKKSTNKINEKLKAMKEIPEE